jgi:hypothetical protein
MDTYLTKMVEKENGKQAQNTTLQDALAYTKKDSFQTYGASSYRRRDDDLETLVEREIQRVFSNKELEATITGLAKYINTPEDYVRVLENGLRANLGRIRGIESIETPEEAAFVSNFLAKYVRRFVEVVSAKIGHSEYIPIGLKVADEVLEDFMDNLE